jgi:hypothetical protein
MIDGLFLGRVFDTGTVHGAYTAIPWNLDYELTFLLKARYLFYVIIFIGQSLRVSYIIFFSAASVTRYVRLFDYFYFDYRADYYKIFFILFSSHIYMPRAILPNLTLLLSSWMPVVLATVIPGNFLQHFLAESRFT